LDYKPTSGADSGVPMLKYWIVVACIGVLLSSCGKPAPQTAADTVGEVEATATGLEVVSSNPVNGASVRNVDKVSIVFSMPVRRGTVEQGIQLYSGKYAPAENPAAFTKLKLTSMCKGYWRVRNPNTSPLSFRWNIPGRTERSVGVVGAKSDAFFYTSAATQTARLLVGSQEQEVKAANATVCAPRQGLSWKSNTEIALSPANLVNGVLGEGWYTLSISSRATSQQEQSLGEPYVLRFQVIKTTPSEAPQITLPAVGVVGSPAVMQIEGEEGLSQASYTWNFGDGSNAGGSLVNKTYTAPGLYTVTLEATTSSGTGRTQEQIHILPKLESLIPSFTNPAVPVTPTGTLNLDLGTPLPGYTYSWDLGDGRTLSGTKVNHTYAKLGTYNVRLQVQPSPGSNLFGSSNPISLGQSLTAAPFQTRFNTASAQGFSFQTWYTHWRKAPIASAKLNGKSQPAVGIAPFSVAFDAGASLNPNTQNTALNYAWDFGDGSSGSGVQTSKTYTTPGVYKVTLTLSQPEGLVDQYKTYVHVRDARSNATLNVFYPEAAAQSVVALEAKGRSNPNLSSTSTKQVKAQVDTVEEVYPYILLPGNNLRSGVFKPLNPDGSETISLCESFVAYFNGTVRPSLLLDQPGNEGLICTALVLQAGSVGRMPVGQNNLLISTSKYLHNTRFNVIAGLRVPKVFVMVVPDATLPGELASPVISEFQTNPINSQPELMLTVRIRQSEVQNLGASTSKIRFKVPVYAVDEAGKLLPFNGLLAAKFSATNIESGCGGDTATGSPAQNTPAGCTMVDGKAYIDVALNPANFGIDQQELDLSRVTVWGGNAACGTDANPTKHRLSGCFTTTTSYALPTGVASLLPPPYPYPLREQATFAGHVVYGSTAQQVAQWDYWIREGHFEDIKEFSTGFVPVYGNSKACYESAVAYGTTSPANFANGALTGLACTGAALEATGVGLILTKPVQALAGLYRTSRTTSNALTKSIEREVHAAMALAPTGPTSARVVAENLQNSFAPLLNTLESCGVSCAKQLDTTLAKLMAGGKTEQAALSELKQALQTAATKTPNPVLQTVYAKVVLTCARPGAAQNSLRAQASASSVFCDGVNIAHIFEGEINKRKKAVGFHHNSPLAQGKARVDKIEETFPGGFYSAKVSVCCDNKGEFVQKGPFSSMWPDAWTQQEVFDDILSAFVNSQVGVDGKANKWRGISSRGTEIEGYLVQAPGIPDINTAYPVLK
jgi:PKD repeat protein